MSGMTGTLVAAAMETSGYKAQSSIVEQLGSMFIELGALVYLVVLIFSVLSLVMGSSPRTAIWLIVAPGLFYFVLFFRIPAEPATWTFGTWDDERDGFHMLPRLASFDDADEEVQIAWVFDRYNYLVSSVYNELIKVFTSHQSLRSMSRFMTRPKLLDALNRSDVQDPGLLALAVHGLASQCSDAMNTLRDIAYARQDNHYRSSSATFQQSLAMLGSVYNGKRVTFPVNSPARTYLANLLVRIQGLPAGELTLLQNTFCEGEFSIPGVSGALIPGLGTSFPLSINFPGLDYNPELAMQSMTCKQLWCYTSIGTYLEAVRLAEVAECRQNHFLVRQCQESDLLNGSIQPASTAIVLDLWKEVLVKMMSPDFLDEESDSLDMHYIPIFMAGSMLRKLVTIDPRSYMTTEYNVGSGYYTDTSGVDTQAAQTLAVDRAMTQDAQLDEAKAIHYQAYIFASLLPYVQGSLLYCLAMLYPFFCIFILIPGRASTFFMWMALWAWVKCWDVGFSIVMIAEEVIWSMLPRQAKFGALLDSLNGPLSLFESSFRGSSSYSLATYYIVVSSLIIGVPMVTAQFILGSRSAIAGVLLGARGGLQSLGQRQREDEETFKNSMVNQYITADNEAAQQAEQSQQSAPTPTNPTASAGTIPRPPLSQMPTFDQGNILSGVPHQTTPLDRAPLPQQALQGTPNLSWLRPQSDPYTQHQARADFAPQGAGSPTSGGNTPQRSAQEADLAGLGRENTAPSSEVPTVVDDAYARQVGFNNKH